MDIRLQEDFAPEELEEVAPEVAEAEEELDEEEEV